MILLVNSFDRPFNNNLDTNLKHNATENATMDTSPPSESLEELLAEVLPKDFNFKITHISTPPTSTEALYSAPPGETPDKTFLETHFLALSARPTTEPEVLVYAIEVLIYTTASSTTLFVSKADSSGFLHLLTLPSGTPSPLKSVTTTFLQYLLKHRCRAGVQTIISLFARAQDQYLFARSIENERKHVLDDTGLVKWWCCILDPLLSTSLSTSTMAEPSKEEEKEAKAYLTIPGLTPHESTSFLPPSASSRAHWSIGDPLSQITRHENPPPRCVIPHFPDDPKSRFLDELDDEVLGNSGSQSQSQSQGSQNRQAGQWRSVKTLEAFWEMMAFRQECSAGRLVGFIWVVFPGTDNSELNHQHESLQEQAQEKEKVAMKKKQSRIKKRERNQKRLTGPVISRPLRIHTSTYKVKKQVSAASTFSRPFSSEDQKNVLDAKDYHRTHELLLCLDFSTLKKASEATNRWGRELKTINIQGVSVVGKSTKKRATNGAGGAVNMLQPRKRKARGEENGVEGRMDGAGDGKPKVNVLSGGMVRKKPKTST